MDIAVVSPAKYRHKHFPEGEQKHEVIGSKFPVTPIHNEGELLDRNRGWLVKVLYKYGRRLIAIVGEEDALSVARIGMLHAIRRWDPAHGALTTYSYQWMRSYLFKAHRLEVRARLGSTQSIDRDLGGGSNTGLDLSHALHSEDQEHEAGVASDGRVIADWFASRHEKGALIALDRLESGDELRVVGARWGISHEMVRLHEVKWLMRARLHFTTSRRRQAS